MISKEFIHKDTLKKNLTKLFVFLCYNKKKIVGK